MTLIATPVSTLYSSKKNINRIIKYSDCLEGRENIETIKNNNIKLIHFDIDIHKTFKKETKIIITNIINKKKLDLLSFQLSSDYYNPSLIKNKYFPKGRKVSKKNIYKNIKNNLEWLQKKLNKECKVAIENNNYYKTGAYNLITNPKFISKIINKYDLYFLFDYAHAKVSAANMSISYKKYISSLPLQKIIQIHFCGYDIINNEAIDSHKTPQKDDYNELKKLCNKINKIRYITLEYYIDIDNLIKSLKIIKKIIS